MKKSKAILAILISGLFVFSLSAQTDKGKFMISGSSSFDFESANHKYKSNIGDGTQGKSTSVTISPQVGYFLINGLAAGLRLDLQYDTYKADGAERDDKDSQTIFDVGPFVRYYLDLSKIKPFAEGALAMGIYNDNDDDNSNLFAFQLKGGVGYFFNDNISIEGGLGFRRTSLKNPHNNPTDNKTVMSSFIMEFGFTIIL